MAMNPVELVRQVDNDVQSIYVMLAGNGVERKLDEVLDLLRGQRG